jgi:uncharacterized protein YqgC (DUF456 family)
MQKPLPFREFAALMLSNVRMYSSTDTDLGRRLGINQTPARAVAYIGQIVGFFTMLAAISLLMDPLLSNPQNVTFSELLFLLAILSAFVTGQLLVSYTLYRFWLSHWPAEA